MATGSQAGLVSINADDIAAAVKGLDDARRNLGRADRVANREVAASFTGWSRQNAHSGTRQEGHFAGALQPGSTQKIARVRIASTGSNRGALGTFFGARRYPQFPAWVGNNWTPASSGQGPYVLNDTAAQHLNELGEMYASARMRAFARAFPEGSQR